MIGRKVTKRKDLRGAQSKSAGGLVALKHRPRARSPATDAAPAARSHGSCPVVSTSWIGARTLGARPNKTIVVARTRSRAGNSDIAEERLMTRPRLAGRIVECRLQSSGSGFRRGLPGIVRTAVVDVELSHALAFLSLRLWSQNSRVAGRCPSPARSWAGAYCRLVRLARLR
jgi:hypothetical protein